MVATTASEDGSPWQRVAQEALADDFHSVDFDPHFVSPDGLHVDVAWSLATQWTNRLVGAMRLGDDHSNWQYSVVPNYEWINIRVGGGIVADADAKRDAEAFAVRATVLVWRALCACRGFDAQEHPVFWKRVLEEMTPTAPQDYREYQTTMVKCCSNDDRASVVSDAYRFFDGVSFPRLRLVLCRDKAVSSTLARDVSIIGGWNAMADDVAVQLESALKTLQPFMCRERLQKFVQPIKTRINWSPDRTPDIDVNALVDMLHSPETDDDSTSVYAQLTKLKLHVTSVESDDCWLPDIKDINVDYRHLRVPLARRRIRCGDDSTVGEYVPPALGGCSTFREYVYWALNPKRRRPGGVWNLMFGHGEDTREIPALCSALPFTTTLVSFTLNSNRNVSGWLYPESFAWLGYALFHPDTSSSTWRRLAIQSLRCDRGEPSAILQWMAQGNNLARALGFTEHISSAYYTARVRAGAVIRETAAHDGAIVETLSEITEMDVCVKTTEVSQLSEWVFVVVIGVGNVWVHRDDVVDITARPAGRPMLSALNVSSRHLSSDVTETLVRLTSGAIRFFAYNYSLAIAETLDVAGIYISRCEAVALPVNVRELAVDDVMPYDIFRLVPALARLEQLETLSVTVRMTEWDEYYLERVQELLQWLVRSLPRLQRLVFADISAGEEEAFQLGYSRMRYVSRRLLGLGRLSASHANPSLRGMPSRATIVALLSVVNWYRDRGDDALGRCDPELLRLICSFVGRELPRDVWMVIPKREHPRPRQVDYVFGFVSDY